MKGLVKNQSPISGIFATFGNEGGNLVASVKYWQAKQNEELAQSRFLVSTFWQRECASATPNCLSFFHHIHDRLESVRVVERQVGQSLAVEADAFLRQRVDEAAVIEPFGTGGGVDARNPEAAENAFFEFAVAEGVLPTFFEGVFRYGVYFRTGAEVTAGSEHDFFPAGTAGRIVGCSWHGCDFLVRSRDRQQANPALNGSFSEILVKKMCC
jgi:hypothetical protein